MAELEPNVTTEPADPAPDSSNSELEKLRADLAKQKAALDKATKEAGDYRKQLREKQTADEIAAEEAKALQQAMQEELEQLRKEKSVASITAKIIPLVDDAAVAGEIAGNLYGAADAEKVIATLQKAWTAKENTLRLEFGKIPSPGVGSGDGPIITKEQLDSMRYVDRAKFASEHPEEYNKLMGR